jgi:hypothetical protein
MPCKLLAGVALIVAVARSTPVALDDSVLLAHTNRLLLLVFCTTQGEKGYVIRPWGREPDKKGHFAVLTKARHDVRKVQV